MHRLLLLTVVAAVVAAAPSFGSPPAGFERLSLTVDTAPTHDAADPRPALLVHFHGAPSTVGTAFREAGLGGVLLTVNCNGLSSAYREPFEDASLFPYLLDRVRDDLVTDGRLGAEARWGRIDVSFFSAGYGAARELLNQPETRSRLAALVAADSIYASIHVDDGRRRVDKEQMAPFVTFAREAARGEKGFLWTHSQLPVEAYASTVETSDYLLHELGLERTPLTESPPEEFTPISAARRGRLAVLAYSGEDGDAHMAHLRRIADAWRWLAQDRAPPPER